MGLTLKTLLMLAASWLSTLGLRAADWPQFRGPDGQGHAEVRGLPTEWSATKNVAWKAAIPGEGWSSPILWQGRIYLTTAVPGGGGLSLRALCLSERDGKVLWNNEVLQAQAVNGHKKNGHASPTPLTDGERLYVHFGQYGTAALDLNGSVLWTNTSLKYPPVHGNGGSPALAGDALIFSCDGASNPFIVALDKATGKVLWRVPRSNGAKKTFSFSTPLLVTNNGQPQIISPTSGAVIAYDPRDGKELWLFRYPEGYSVVPRPVVGEGLIFFSSAFDNPIFYAIRPGGHGDVTETHLAWSQKRGAPKTCSPLLVGEEIYWVSDEGLMACADAKTGQTHWQERVGGNYSASPAYADGKIFIQSEEGVGTVLKPGKIFAVLAKNDLHERTLASYAFDDNAIFLRSIQYLYRLQAPMPSAAAGQ